MRAIVSNIRENQQGSALQATLTAGDSTVKVLSAADFPTSGSCVIAGHTIAYKAVLYAEDGDAAVDTLVLVGTSPVSGTALTTLVNVPGAVEYIAQVTPLHSDGSLDAYIDPKLTTQEDFDPAPLVGALVYCEWRPYGPGKRLWLVDLISARPKIDAMSIPGFGILMTGTQANTAAIAGNTSDIATLQAEIDALTATVAGLGGDVGIDYSSIIIDAGYADGTGQYIIFDDGLVT